MSDSLEPRPGAAPEPASTGGDKAAKARDASAAHTVNTNVTIAWPFSRLKVQEASAELTELAGLLGELVEALSDVVPEDRLTPLRERVESLRARLR